MNITYTQLSTKGLVTIPKQIRQALGLDPQEQPLLKLTQDEGKIVIEPVEVIPTSDLRIYSDKEVDEFIENDTLTAQEKKDAKDYLKNFS